METSLKPQFHSGVRVGRNEPTHGLFTIYIADTGIFEKCQIKVEDSRQRQRAKPSCYLLHFLIVTRAVTSNKAVLQALAESRLNVLTHCLKLWLCQTGLGFCTLYRGLTVLFFVLTVPLTHYMARQSCSAVSK